jgi:hypothetical protein
MTISIVHNTFRATQAGGYNDAPYDYRIYQVFLVADMYHDFQVRYR